MSPHYDYIIAGGGAAGLSLLHALLQSPTLRQKQILLVDREAKTENDHTWCFWEEGAGPFEAIVHHRWSTLWVHQGEEFSRCMPIAPFAYKMIQATDLYRYMEEVLQNAPNVTRRFGHISHIENAAGAAQMVIDGETYTADYVFSSIARPAIDKSEVQYLDQHFRGWFIRTATAVFRPDEAVLMDFRTPQHGETRFLYVLPTSTTEALVEVAIFSTDHLQAEGYDKIIDDYLRQHWPQVSDYTIIRTEQGNIPMTDYRFDTLNGRIVHIGMTGGDTRASSGYTFYNIQRRVAALVQRLERGLPLTSQTGVLSARHQFYDSVLLQVLVKNGYAGDELFRQLFARGSALPLLRFLNGESGWSDELQVILRAPILPFTKAALLHLTKKSGPST